MARIKYTALVESIRGSIGGTTFQRNAYGYTVKSKPTIVNPNTQRQRRSKANLQLAQQAWRNLSDSDRATWDSYASTYPVPSRLNPDAYLGGQQLFIRWMLFGLLDATTIGPVEDPPGTAEFEQQEAVLDTGALHALSSWTGVTESWKTIHMMTAPLIATQNITKSKLRYVGSVTGTNVDTDVSTLYVNAFGALPAVGQRIGMQTILIQFDSATIIRGPQEIVTVTS